LPEIIIDYIIKFKENIQPNTNDIFKLKCIVNIMEFYDDNSKVITDNIAEIISEADEYN